MNEIKQGFTFRFTNHGSEFIVLYTTDDGYYALCQCTTDKEVEIYAAVSLEDWLRDGIIEYVGHESINVNISYTED